MNQNAIAFIDSCLKEKMKKVIGLMKDELGRKFVTKCFGLRAKTFQIPKAKGQESKKGTQLQSEIDHLENSKINAHNIKKIITDL